MNPDFAEILSELIAAGAELMIVGAFAVAAQQFRVRRSKDLVDLAWIEEQLKR